MLKLKLSCGSFVEILLVSLAGLALCAPAFAGSVYHWQTEDGTYSFTDDAKRIPEAYRDAAKRRTMGRLGAYKRLTPAPKVEKRSYDSRLETRLAHLRGLQAQEQSAYHHRRHGFRHGAHKPVSVRVNTAGGHGSRTPTVEFGVDPRAGDGPVVVEEVRSLEPGKIATRTVTVVRQGDRVLSVVKPLNSAEHDPSDIVDDRDFE